MDDEYTEPPDTDDTDDASAHALRGDAPTPPADDLARADLADVYAKLHGLVLDRADVSDFLQDVARLAATLAPDAACGITMREDREVTTVASSHPFAADIDEIQYGRGQGPCLQSLHTGEVVVVDDMTTDGRWPAYGAHAVAHGLRGSLSVPMRVEGAVTGAMNVYSRRPAVFGPGVRDRIEAFSAQAASALTVVLRAADQAMLQEQMRAALATRSLIDQALGIIMGRQRVDATTAFAVLREASQSRNRKMRDIAAELIESTTGRPPVPPRPFTDPR